nr:hypothetical protein [Planomonospora venezuelensis]
MRRLQALRPDHVARRAVRGASGVLEQARIFAEDALDGAARRETELRARLGLGTVEETTAENTYHYDVKDGR